LETKSKSKLKFSGFISRRSNKYYPVLR